MVNIKTLEGLKAFTHAYDSFKTIENCSIPDYYKGVFPTTCACGAELIMTEPDHTQLQCCDPCCRVKMAKRLAYFFSSLGYKGFGESSALDLYNAVWEKLPYQSFLAVFTLTDTEIASGLDSNYTNIFLDIKNSIHNSAFHFSTAIAALGIPGVGSRSTLFDVVKGPAVLLHFVLNNSMDQLADMCGIQSPMSKFQLYVFKLDIILLMKDVMPHIMDTPKEELYIAITGRVSVGGLDYSRQEFVRLCESLKDADGVQRFKIVETKAESKLEAVIADNPSNSDKYLLGERLGILMTADAFYAGLKEKCEVAEQCKE